MQHRPDAVLHFAALTIAPESVRDPAPYWRVNTGGTLNVLDAMRDAGVPAIVFSSTAAVYGTPEQIPIPEDAPLQPINPYGASKLAAERAVASYAEAYGLAYAALRYFNVAGASGEVGEDHRPETHLIPSALDAAAGWREPLSVFGTDFPTCRRNGHSRLRPCRGPDRRPFAGSGPRCRRRQLARRDQSWDAGRRLGARSSRRGRTRDRDAVPTLYAGRRPGDPAILVADASRAETVLGWQPRRSNLDEMVSSAWNWRQRFPVATRCQPIVMPVERACCADGTIACMIASCLDGSGTRAVPSGGRGRA